MRRKDNPTRKGIFQAFIKHPSAHLKHQMRTFLRPLHLLLFGKPVYWKHDIRLEKVLPLNSKRVFPVCTGGQRPVPPKVTDVTRRCFDRASDAYVRLLGDLRDRDIKAGRPYLERYAVDYFAPETFLVIQ